MVSYTVNLQLFKGRLGHRQMVIMSLGVGLIGRATPINQGPFILIPINILFSGMGLNGR